MNISMRIGVIASIIFCRCIVTSGQWIVTSTVRQEDENGANGQCERSTSGSNLPTCAGNWQRRPEESGGVQELENGCRYFLRTTVFFCHGAEGEAGAQGQLCVRKRYFYSMRSECYQQWLGWQRCSAECGGGVQLRYKFLSKSSPPTSEERNCNTQACPSWSSWMRASEGCTDSCTVLSVRQCVYQGAEIPAERCPSVESSSSNSNGTHRLEPCSETECAPHRATSTITSTQTRRSATSTSSTTSSPNDMIQRLSTLNPKQFSTPFTDQYHQTSIPENTSNFDLNTENSSRKTETDLPLRMSPGSGVCVVPIFGSKPFWVGFCIGVAFLFGIFLLLLLVFKIKKGTLCSSKVLHQNGKVYYEQASSQRSARASGNHQLLPSVGNATEMKLEGKASITSTSCMYKDDGNRFRHNNGSLPHQPTLPENYHQPIEPIAYETFYTPVGESKLQNRSLPQVKEPLLADIPDHSFASRESFLTETDTNSEPNEDPDYENTSTYYNQYPFNTLEPKLLEQGGFDEVAYVRKYESCRSERRRQKSLEDGRMQRIKVSDRQHKNSDDHLKPGRRRKSFDSRASEPHYAKPMKCAVNQPHYACVNRKNENGERKASPDSLYIKRMSVRSISTPTLAAPVKMDEDEFEFPSPPKFAVDE